MPFFFVFSLNDLHLIVVGLLGETGVFRNNCQMWMVREGAGFTFHHCHSNVFLEIYEYVDPVRSQQFVLLLLVETFFDDEVGSEEAW